MCKGMKTIDYELYRNNNRQSAGYGRVYARMRHGRTYDLDALCSEMSSRGSLWPEDVMKGVIRRAVIEVTHLLCEGHKVKLDDLCILSLGIKSRGADDESQFRADRDIERVTLNVQPTGDMRENMKSIKMKKERV